MNIEDKVAIVTGAASGIGRAVAAELVPRGVAAVAMVDRCDAVQEAAAGLGESAGKKVCLLPFIGDVTDDSFRTVFDEIARKCGTPTICVPAAGITRDKLAVRLNKETGKAMLYPIEDFVSVLKVNLVAPVYWALEMVGKIAESRHARGLKRWAPPEHVEGTAVFIGSVSSHGIAGQIAYSATKAGLDGVKRHADARSDLPRGALRRDPPRVHGHADGPRVGRRVHRAEDPAANAVEASRSAGRDRHGHLFCDRGLGHDRRSLDRRRMASASGLIRSVLSVSWKH